MESQLKSKGLIFSEKSIQFAQPSSSSQKQTFGTQNVIRTETMTSSGLKSSSTFMTSNKPSGGDKIVYRTTQKEVLPRLEFISTVPEPQIAICEWKIPEQQEIKVIQKQSKAPTYERRVETTYVTRNEQNPSYVQTKSSNYQNANLKSYNSSSSGNVKILSSNMMVGNYVTSNNSSSVFDKSTKIKTVNLNDFPTVGQEQELPVQSIARKSTTVKTMSIFDLEDVSKKEKKVIEMGKKLQKEKIIISHDGEIKKEDNETTLIIKNMTVDEKDETESVINEETENMEQEDSDLPLEKEIEQEVEAQTGIVINEREGVRESKREVIVDQLMDDMIGKYDTNFTAEEEVIISEYKENLLNNYLDETMNNIEAANDSFFNENNKSYNGKDINMVVSEDLKKKLQEIPTMLKEAEEQGILDQMMKEKEIEMKKNSSEAVEVEVIDEVENVQEKVEEVEEEVKETVQDNAEDIMEEEKFKMIIIKENNEQKENEEDVVNTQTENVKNEEVIIEEIDDKQEEDVDSEFKTEIKQEIIVEEPETIEEVFEQEELQMEKQPEEFKEPAVVEIYKEDQEEGQVEIKFHKRTAPVKTHTHTHDIEITKHEVDEEGYETEVIEHIEIIHNEDKHFEEKLENFEDYIQDAEQAGFFDKLIEEKRKKEQEAKLKVVTKPIEVKNEKPSSKRDMLEYAKNKKNKMAFGEIKNQLLLEANIKPKEKEEVKEKVTNNQPIKQTQVQTKEESDIEFENAFESDDDIKQETQIKTVQPTYTRPKPVPVRVQPASNNGVSRVVTNTKNVSVKRIDLDSFDIRRYNNKDQHSLTQSRLTESGTWGESIRNSRPGGLTAYPQDRTSVGIRTVQSNANIRSNNMETTKQTYQRFENIKQMKPMHVNSTSQIRTSRIGLNNWNSSNSNLKTSKVITKNTVTNHQITPVQEKTTNTRLQTFNNNKYENKSNEYKVSTLSSIIKSNVNQTHKKPTSYNTSSISSTQKKEYSNSRTPTTRTGKKKINLSHYKSKKVNTSSQPLRFTESGRNEQNRTVTTNNVTTNINNNSRVRQGNNFSSVQTTRTVVSKTQGISGERVTSSVRTQGISNLKGSVTRVQGSSGTKRRIKI